MVVEGKSYFQARALSIHMRRLWEHERKISSDTSLDSHVQVFRIVFLFVLAEALSYSWDYKEAKKYIKEAILLSKNALQDENLIVEIIYMVISSIYVDFENRAELEFFIENLAVLRMSVQEISDKIVERPMHEKSFLPQALITLEKTFGRNHTFTAFIGVIMGIISLCTLQYEKAIDYLSVYLRLFKRGVPYGTMIVQKIEELIDTLDSFGQSFPQNFKSIFMDDTVSRKR
jgi:tetratricopeptide (TPR) repeat protein